MKILAATPVQYKDTNYIVALDSSELVSLLAICKYQKIQVIDSGGLNQVREKTALIAGDEIDRSSIIENYGEMRGIVEQQSEINKAFSILKGAMTKVQNTFKL
jgi:hypothetical protein